jgi:hypothetical protein
MPSYCTQPNNSNYFIVSVWLGNGANKTLVKNVKKVASAHQKTYFYIEAESQYLQNCTVDLIEAAGMSVAPQLIEFLPSQGTSTNNPPTAGPKWIGVKPALLVLPPAPPGGMSSGMRMCSIKSVPSTSGATTEGIKAEIDYSIGSGTAKLTPSITVDL